MFHLDGLVLFGKRDGGKNPVAEGEDCAVGVAGVGIADDFGIAVAIDIGDIEDVEGNAKERPKLVGEVFHIGMKEVAGGGTVGGGAVEGVEGIGRKAVGQKKRMEHDAVGVEVILAGVDHSGAVVAAVAYSVAVSVLLQGIVVSWTVVTFVADAVVVRVYLGRIVGDGAVVALVADAVMVHVLLIRVVCAGAVVLQIGHAVHVEIG